MRGDNILGIVFANADEAAISEITGIRSMASVPFGGAYRLIDFVLSDMVNSGITKVGIITDNNYQSLMDHIGNGMPWDLARKTDGLYLLPPFNAEATVNYNAGRVGALKNIMHFLQKSSQEYVLLSDCSYVANVDLAEVYAQHEETKADITLLYNEGQIPTLRTQPVIAEMDGMRIKAFSLQGENEAQGKYILKAALMKKSLLERLVNETYAKGYYSFEKDFFVQNAAKLNICGFKVNGFCRVIDSLKSYFDANASLLVGGNFKKLFTPLRPIYTKVYDDMPAVYGLGSHVGNSLIADGCVIEGTVENCILFRDCRVEKDAVVKNAVLMPHTFIGTGASINYCITDKSVTVRASKVLSGADSYPVYIGKGIHI